MASILLKVFSPVLRKAARIYTSKERQFSYKGISIVVKPGVFHPGLFFSSKLLLDFTDTLDLNAKSFLELGAGTGIISILAAKKNATVYSSDLSSGAIENIRINSQSNNIEVTIIQSDLFEEIPQQAFDYLIINPPYFNIDPKTEAEYAWNCGSNFEYFHSLFETLSDYMSGDSSVFMILSEASNINKIKSIGIEREFMWSIVVEKRIWGEWNYIFRISKS